MAFRPEGGLGWECFDAVDFQSYGEDRAGAAAGFVAAGGVAVAAAAFAALRGEVSAAASGGALCGRFLCTGRAFDRRGGRGGA